MPAASACRRQLQAAILAAAATLPASSTGVRCGYASSFDHDDGAWVCDKAASCALDETFAAFGSSFQVGHDYDVASSRAQLLLDGVAMPSRITLHIAARAGMDTRVEFHDENGTVCFGTRDAWGEAFPEDPGMPPEQFYNFTMELDWGTGAVTYHVDGTVAGPVRMGCRGMRRVWMFDGQLDEFSMICPLGPKPEAPKLVPPPPWPCTPQPLTAQPLSPMPLSPQPLSPQPETQIPASTFTPPTTPSPEPTAVPKPVPKPVGATPIPPPARALPLPAAMPETAASPAPPSDASPVAVEVGAPAVTEEPVGAAEAGYVAPLTGLGVVGGLLLLWGAAVWMCRRARRMSLVPLAQAHIMIEPLTTADAVNAPSVPASPDNAPASPRELTVFRSDGYIAAVL